MLNCTQSSPQALTASSRASSVGAAKIGSPEAAARPLAVASPTRRPVNRPGPAETRLRMTCGAEIAIDRASVGLGRGIVEVVAHVAAIEPPDRLALGPQQLLAEPVRQDPEIGPLDSTLEEPRCPIANTST